MLFAECHHCCSVGRWDTAAAAGCPPAEAASQCRLRRAGILLHTSDSGKTWTRVPLSNKLPGAPLKVFALPKSGGAEMCTEAGAIYVTDNAGYSWKAAVQETVDATLNRTVSSGISGASYYEGSFANIVRSKEGNYVGVSSRGNFYMTWSPGDAAWKPHNRPTTRRLQNLGWANDERLWVTTRGGDVLFSENPGVDASDFSNARIGSRGFGLLDIGCGARCAQCALDPSAVLCEIAGSRGACPCVLILRHHRCHRFQDGKVCYACGGSGSLFKSEDAGKTFKRLKGLDKVPANLYAVAFNSATQGFILGNDGVLLRYIA